LSVRPRPKRRQKPPDAPRLGHGEPSALIWLVALIGMALPWIAAALAITGLLHVSGGDARGGWLIAAGAAAWLGDLAVDQMFAHRATGASDDPDLNRRAAQLVGRLLLVAEAIEGGRGKVSAGDTLWAAEGADAPAGARVSVTGSNGTTLKVVRAHD
jgi:membrane protein implicated in regulation of membrane protease activity